MLSILAVAALVTSQSVPPANPVTDALRDIATQSARNLSASAELMPAEKYGFRPTDAQMTFGALIAHIVQANFALCSMFSDKASPRTPEQLQKISGTDSKESLAAAVKESFAYCTAAVTSTTDAQLGQEAAMFGKPTGKTRAFALITIATDWADHYSSAASYLRLNGILPPTAQPAK
jgi:hypothetical protein